MATADPNYKEASGRAISKTIADFATNCAWDRVPEGVRDRAKLLILDALGIALAANRYPFAATLRAGLESLAAIDASPKTSRVIGSSVRLPLRDAVVMNAGLVHGLDFDDTHMASVIHATSVALPTALSVGEVVGATGIDVLSAYIAATEIAIRIGLTANFGFHKHGLHATGLVGHFSSAVAAGRLFGLDAEQIAGAQGIVGSTAMASQEFVADGAWNKRFHPGWAAVAGITAAKLAQAGFVAPSRPYEGRFGIFRSLLGTEQGAFDIGKMTAGLGTVWETEQVAIKPFPTCHFAHAATDCALYLGIQHNIDPQEIFRIDVRIPEGTIQVIAEPREAKIRPTSEYDGKFSVQYIVAAALHKKCFGLAELDVECMSDPKILETASKIHHSADSISLFPKAYSGGVRITMKSGKVYDHYEAVNRGAGERALSRAEVTDKFMANACLVIPKPKAETICALVLDIERHDARALMRQLAA